MKTDTSSETVTVETDAIGRWIKASKIVSFLCRETKTRYPNLPLCFGLTKGLNIEPERAAKNADDLDGWLRQTIPAIPGNEIARLLWRSRFNFQESNVAADLAEWMTRNQLIGAS